jgi:hypothetical protein
MTTTLMPDTERRLLSVPDYLERIRGTASEAAHRAILEDVPALQAIFRSGYPMPDGMPELMISTEARSFIEMQDFACRVVMSTGFMEDALTTCRYADPKLRAAGHFMVFGDLTVARLRILWAVGHETVHYIRRHDLMQSHFGNSPEVLQALEWDADLCSAAAVFRLVQRRKPHLASLRCKLVPD